MNLSRDYENQNRVLIDFSKPEKALKDLLSYNLITQEQHDAFFILPRNIMLTLFERLKSANSDKDQSIALNILKEVALQFKVNLLNCESIIGLFDLPSATMLSALKMNTELEPNTFERLPTVGTAYREIAPTDSLPPEFAQQVMKIIGED